MIPITKKDVDSIKDESENPADFVTRLYKLAVPNLANVKKLHGYVAVSPETAKYIWDAMLEYKQEVETSFKELIGCLPKKDRKLIHKIRKEYKKFLPKVWKQRGFKTKVNIPNWMLDISKIKIIY